MQNQTLLPRRFPKIVPTTIVFDGRGGAKLVVVAILDSAEEEEEVESWFSWS